MGKGRRAIASALIFALAQPSLALAAAPREEIVRASLAIDTTALGDAKDVVQDRIRVRGEALLRKHEVLPAKSARDPVISIVVAPIGAEPGYRCSFAVRQGDTVVPDTEGTSLCQLCTEEELVEHIEAAIERVVPRVPTSASESTTPTETSTSTPAPRPRAELRTLGRVGLASALTGGVALGVGVGLAVRPSPPLDDRPTKHRDTRPAGIAVASVSLALLVAGLAMVAVDMQRGRNPGGLARRSQRRVRMTPSTSPRGAGLLVHGWF